MSVYTLDQWTSAKDIISIHELTRLSVTLKYWYMLFIVSLIEVGSAGDVLAVLTRGSFIDDGKGAYAVLVGKYYVSRNILNTSNFKFIYDHHSTRSRIWIPFVSNR